jgi:hypothetical protein
MNKVFLFVGFALFFSMCSNVIKGQTTISHQQATIKPGDRVRLKVVGMPSLAGKYERFTGDSVAIRLGRNYNFITMTVPIDQIIRIEVPQKSRFTPFEKILIGTLIGASAGALFGLIVPDSPTLDHGGFYYWTRGGTVMLWGAIGAGGGLIVGIGVAAASSERWIPATIAGNPLDHSTYFTGISIGWRIRF